MADYLASLRRLENVLKNSLDNSAISMSELTEQLTAAASNNSDLAGDIEIALRSLLVAMISEMDPKHGFTEESPAIKLIKLAIDYSLSIDSSSSLPKVPFLLIEDLLESQTIQKVPAVTACDVIIDYNNNNDTTGKFTMLKTCNSLLRKLSKSYDTEFCGRILLFLATIYPISERSAVNLMGKVNVNNVTFYEDEETYNQNMSFVEAQKAEHVVGEDGEEVEIKGLVMSYELYRKFWKLQNFFCSESKSFDDPKDFWNDFMAHARIVIDTLDRAGLGDNAGSPSSSVMTQSDNGDEEEKSGCKFLTSSQLFGLQCRDPQFRQQIAVQLLFFTHYFKVKLLPTIDGDKKVEYTKDIAFVESKAEALVSTPSTTRSRDLLQTVQRILDRESHWIKWKAASCPPFERSPVSGGAGSKRSADELLAAVLPPNKYCAMDQMPALSSVKYAFDCSDANVKQVSQQLAAAIPDFEEQIQQYLDADDPEAGIEEEYHPKHDQLYCWRTRRMLSDTALDMFKVMKDGNLGKGLRKLKNLPEPVPVEKEMEVESDAENDLDNESSLQEKSSTEEQQRASPEDEAANQQMEVDEQEVQQSESVEGDQSIPCEEDGKDEKEPTEQPQESGLENSD